jgi:hypothetical protein
MSLEALYRVVKYSYKQLVTMRLLPLHACTTLAMNADELEGTNVLAIMTIFAYLAPPTFNPATAASATA